MKKTKIIIYILILIHIFTGCAAQEVTTDVLPEDYEAIKKRYEGMAVAIDTVVDIFEEADINSERKSQCLFNEPVTIIEQTDSWVNIKTLDGSVGWLRSKYVDTDCTSIMNELYDVRIIVTCKKKTLYTNYGGGATLKDVSMGTELFVKSKKKNYYEVAVPGGITGWIEQKDTIQIEANVDIPKTSAADFVTTAKKFEDTQYIVGGTSAWQGVDDSGVAYISAKINGVTLQRDALKQSDGMTYGPEGVDKIQTGDILLFSANEDLEDIASIGIYIGDNNFIYANKTKGCIDSTSLDSEHYKKRIKGIKRIF